MASDKIHVALASDDNYFEGLLTTAWSIARNCSRQNQIVFHILDGGIADGHWNLFAERLGTFNCSIDRISINQSSTFAGFKSYHGPGRMTYARQLLPNLLPNVDQIIYSDVDILWVVDIAELWDKLNPNAIIHCTPSNHTIPAELKWYEATGHRFEFGKRFCAGMIVMNLKKFRAESLHEKMLAAISASNGQVPCCDETVLNAYTFFRNDRQFLDFRWQHMSYGQPKPLEANGFVLHFGTDAPWQSVHKYHHLLTDQHLIWHGFHAEARMISPWKSMRMCNGILDILICRSLYLLGSRHPRFGQLPVKLLLWIRGKPTKNEYMETYLRPFKLEKGFKVKLLPKSCSTPIAAAN